MNKSVALEDVKYNPVFHLSSKWRINSMLHCGRVGPCGSGGKGDISLWLGGKGVYIHTASMTHISCLPEHSLLRSHTRRKPLIEANPTTMTCVMLKPTQITATECFSSVLCSVILHHISQQNRPLPCCVRMFWPLCYTETQSLVCINLFVVTKLHFPFESWIKHQKSSPI